MVIIIVIIILPAEPVKPEIQYRRLSQSAIYSLYFIYTEKEKEKEKEKGCD